jgi:hypothetical protein
VDSIFDLYDAARQRGYMTQAAREQWSKASARQRVALRGAGVAKTRLAKASSGQLVPHTEVGRVDEPVLLWLEPEVADALGSAFSPVEGAGGGHTNANTRHPAGR